ncbi:unnamed protein product [Clonostachys byssicola]|uniref:C2H2-type domain-containing protein n=1 Tax=Clonostachys byssicola TaxID=160290 RepID=A0A9N9Y8D9_9HYPO|nr:unnamed protein product [Clonostachys byssicola]
MELDTKIQPQELLYYNKGHQVIICTSCQYAIQPTALDRHLKEIHALHRHLRQPYTDFAARLPLKQPSELVGTRRGTILGDDEDFPVPGLPVVSGLQCLDPDCGHLCVSVKRMQSHWKAEHHKSGCAALDWQTVPLQTFFRGNLLRYFTHPALSAVKLPDTSSESVDHHIRGIQDAWESHTDLKDSDKSLLAHYLQSTHLSLANRHGNARLWQINVPRIAASNSFLLYGILALSAQHLLNTEQGQSADRHRLMAMASEHHRKAMAVFEATIDAKPSSALECHGIIAFIHVNTLLYFSNYGIDSLSGIEDLFLADASQLGLGYLSSWLHYVRHGCHLVCGFWDTIGNGPLASLAASWDIPIIMEDERSSQIATILLSALDHDCFDGHQISDQLQTIYVQAANELALAINAAREFGSALTIWDAIRLWPLTLSLDFVDEVKKETPRSMTLLACYCIILENLDDVWFAEGLSTRLFSTTCRKLQKGQRELLHEVTQRIRSILREFILEI